MDAIDENGRPAKILGVARYQLRDPAVEEIPRSEQPLIHESEDKIVQHILSQPRIFNWFFEFMVSASLGPPPRNREVDILAALPRSVVGLEPNAKPGDFDVILLPRSTDGYFLSEIMAVEVKVLRSRRNNRNKHPRPSGATQARGMLQDGFPFVGILHLVLCESSRVEDLKPLVRVRILNDYGEAEQLPGTFPTDLIGVETAQRQFGRLRRCVAGTEIGAKAITVYLDDAGDRIMGRDLHNREIAPTKNAVVDLELMKRFCNVAASIKRQ